MQCLEFQTHGPRWSGAWQRACVRLRDAQTLTLVCLVRAGWGHADSCVTCVSSLLCPLHSEAMLCLVCDSPAACLTSLASQWFPSSTTWPCQRSLDETPFPFFCTPFPFFCTHVPSGAPLCCTLAVRRNLFFFSSDFFGDQLLKGKLPTLRVQAHSTYF